MSPQGDIYLVTGHTDMRKSIDGLSLIVSEVLELNPLSSAWFIFVIASAIKSKFCFGTPMVFGSITDDWKKAVFNGLAMLLATLLI